jgi:hypothetical protein
VLKRRVLRKIFGPKGEEAIGDLRRLCNEKLHGLYSLPDIIGVITSRMMRVVGHVAHTWENTGVYRVVMGKFEGKNHLEELGIDQRKILK